MKKVYVVCHVDCQSDNLINSFLEQNVEFRFDLESAQKLLETYLQNGLEYNIQVLSISID